MCVGVNQRLVGGEGTQGRPQLHQPPLDTLSACSPGVSGGSCSGWGLILNLVIYECVPTSNFPPGDRAQVRRQVWVVFLQQVGTARDGSVLTVQRLTGKGHGGSRCKCLVLPEAERCVFHPSLHPPSAPKRYHHHPPTPQVCPGRLLSQGPSAAPPSYSFFFFFRPTQQLIVCGKSLCALRAGPTT